MSERHYSALESMYQAAPINQIYQPQMQVSKGEAVISMVANPEHFHSGGALHGSVYFKMLDDAAFFAANSLVEDVFVLTSAFTTYLTRPVTGGTLTAKGKVVSKSRTQFIVEAVLENDQGKEVARGNGIMVKGRLPLTDAKGYA